MNTQSYLQFINDLKKSIVQSRYEAARLSNREQLLLYYKTGMMLSEKLNETFPQEERLLENEFSINLPAQYNLKGKIRKSWINIINPFRSFLVMGSPGSGKTWFVIQHVIKQHIQKRF